jgi:hypothetical protein
MWLICRFSDGSTEIAEEQVISDRGREQKD